MGYSSDPNSGNRWNIAIKRLPLFCVGCGVVDAQLFLDSQIHQPLGLRRTREVFLCEVFSYPSSLKTLFLLLLLFHFFFRQDSLTNTVNLKTQWSILPWAHVLSTWRLKNQTCLSTCMIQRCQTTQLYMSVLAIDNILSRLHTF